MTGGGTATANSTVAFGARVLLTLKDPNGAPIDVPGKGCWGSMFVEFNGKRFQVNGDCSGGYDFDNGTYEPYVVMQGRTYFLEGWPRGSNYGPVFYNQKRVSIKPRRFRSTVKVRRRSRS